MRKVLQDWGLHFLGWVPQKHESTLTHCSATLRTMNSDFQFCSKTLFFEILRKTEAYTFWGDFHRSTKARLHTAQPRCAQWIASFNFVQKIYRVVCQSSIIRKPLETSCGGFWQVSLFCFLINNFLGWVPRKNGITLTHCSATLHTINRHFQLCSKTLFFEILRWCVILKQ